jgi:hypothetical protein
MEYWLSHKSGRVIEQVLCEDGDAPRWSDDSKRCTKVQVERHGDLLAETFDAETLTWSPSTDHAVKCLKEERNRLLAECDLPPLFERPEAEQPAWREYRQALRDMPETTTDPFNPEWPTQPTFGE